MTPKLPDLGGPGETPDAVTLLKRFGHLALRSNAASALIAAVGFNIVIAWNGEWLAVGFAFYKGVLEPSEPSLAYPVFSAGLPLILSLVSLVADPILKKPWLSWAGLLLALVGGGVGVSHLMNLLELASR